MNLSNLLYSYMGDNTNPSEALEAFTSYTTSTAIALEAISADIASDLGSANENEKKAMFKIDTFEKKYTLLNKYWKTIEDKLPKNEGLLFRYISTYRSRFSKILDTPYFHDYPVWDRTKDVDIIFEVTGIGRREFSDDFDNIERPGFYTIKKFNLEAYHILLLFYIRYYLKKKETTKAQMLYYYFAYSMYWMAYTNSFKKYKPKYDIVVYTVNNLSKRPILKKVGSINALLFYAVSMSIELHMARLMSGSDYELVYIADNIRTRIGEYMNYLASEFYKNVENKDIIFKGSEIMDTGEQRVATSATATAISLADQKTTAFFSSAPREDIINRIAVQKKLDRMEIRNVISYLINNGTFDEVHKFYESIFYMFLLDSNNTEKDIRSIYFLSEMEKNYRKGNTSDENILAMRRILNEWLEVASSLYQNASKTALKNDYRKAIFMYFIHEIASNK